MKLFNLQRQWNSIWSPHKNWAGLRWHQIVLGLVFCLVFYMGWVGKSIAQKVDSSGSVSVAMLSGSPVIGLLVSADSSKIIVQTKTGTMEKSTADVGRVSFANKLEPQKPPVELTLLDGSRAFGTKLTGKSSGWILKEASGNEIAIPSKSLKAVQLKPIAPELANAWQSAILETKNADAVIVARPGNSLDRINGVIVQVQEASVSFELDGQQIDIPIEKLVGLVWFQRDLERVKPTVEVSATDHSVWMAESLSMKSNVFELKTQLGQSVSIPLNKILSIHYATANIRWLSEVESLDSAAEKLLEFKTPIASLGRAMAPRFVVNGHAPMATSLSADKDLYFPGPGHFSFRVPEGFSSLLCRVERTDDGSQRTDLIIEVWQDDQKIAEETLAHNVDFFDVNVPLKSEKKTKLAIACKSKLMIGTEVTWKQPRLKR